MKIINKCFSGEEFKKYIEKKKVIRKINKVVLHHTWDTIKQWNKEEISIKYYKKLYENKDWTAGPHIFVAPEGIWLFTDITYQGIHANKGNEGSIGIEMVGKYDGTYPKGRIWKNTKAVLRLLLKKFNLEIKDIHFHREYNPDKSCPGRLITKKWIKEKIK